MSKTLITGGCGFIGSHIVQEFLANEVDVVCLVKSSSDTSFLNSLNVELVTGDITDIDSIVSALAGIDYVVHAAGKSSDWGRYQDFYNANVLGTMNILKACRKCGINDLTITGSISSYGEENSRTVKDENSPYKSHYSYFGFFPSAMNYYRDTKAELTRQSIAFARRNAMNLTVIEPVWVYGEREFHTGFYEYIKAVGNGMSFAPGSQTNRFHVVYAKDLAKAYYLAYAKRLNGVSRMIIGQPRTVLLDDVYRLFCKEAGLKKPTSLPKWLVYPLGFALEALYTLLHSASPPILTRARVNMMYDNIEYSTEKAKNMLGFVAGTSLETGIKNTVNWYRTNGYL
ncbi:MAG: NAD-dependent epimerase/dehydratase family protein [Candidatus Cloacimonetes bacterium]|nr:NAD-dependent epimerase/dehydratase family protein [Candidatus Cloacimonadota bacterium]